MQFRRRWRNPADAHGLRHLHRRLQNTGRESRGDGLENGTELYTLTDGTNDAWARSVCVADGTVYVAGYEQQPDGVVAKLWENGTLKYTLGSGGGNSYAYAVTAVRGSVYTAGSEEDGGALTAKVWKDGTELYAYSVSPATSQAKAIAATGSNLFAAGSLSSGTSEPTAQIWKTTRRTSRSATANPLPGPMRSATTDGPSTPPAAAAAKPSYGGTATCSTRSPTAVPTPKRPPCSAPETACTPQATTWTASRKRAWSGKRAGIFDLSDGQASGCQPYAIAVYGGDIFTAGTLFGTTRTAVVWHGEDIRYTLTDGSGHGEAYSMYVVPRYD